MIESILELIKEDYYYLWEIKDIMSRSGHKYSDDILKSSIIEMIESKNAACYLSSDLKIDNLKMAGVSESIKFISDERNWRMPTDEMKEIVRIGII